MAARQRQQSPWGWHRLDNGWARRLVARAAIEPDDLVVDVGAGSGSLTRELLRARARVIAVELHPTRANQLRDRFAGAPVVVVQTDATDLRLPTRPFAVVANPPFATLECLVTRILAHGSRLTRAELVVPRYVARKWTGRRAPGRNRWERTFEVTTGWAVPRSAFHPAPPHDAVVLTVIRRGHRPTKIR